MFFAHLQFTMAANEYAGNLNEDDSSLSHLGGDTFKEHPLFFENPTSVKFQCLEISQ